MPVRFDLQRGVHSNEIHFSITDDLGNTTVLPTTNPENGSGQIFSIKNVAEVYRPRGVPSQRRSARTLLVKSPGPPPLGRSSDLGQPYLLFIGVVLALSAMYWTRSSNSVNHQVTSWRLGSDTIGSHACRPFFSSCVNKRHASPRALYQIGREVCRAQDTDRFQPVPSYN